MYWEPRTSSVPYARVAISGASYLMIYGDSVSVVDLNAMTKYEGFMWNIPKFIPICVSGSMGGRGCPVFNHFFAFFTSFFLFPVEKILSEGKIESLLGSALFFAPGAHPLDLDNLRNIQGIQPQPIYIYIGEIRVKRQKKWNCWVAYIILTSTSYLTYGRGIKRLAL